MVRHRTRTPGPEGTPGAWRVAEEREMFRCERCGTGFNPTVAGTLACCPRCRARDGVEAAVSFSLFELPGRRPVKNPRREAKRHRL